MSELTATCQRCGAPVSEGSLYCSKCGADVTVVPGANDETLRVSTLDGPSSRIQSSMREMLRDATLGEYEILSELGRGGMATVFLAHDVSLDRRVAIKVLAPHLLEGEGMAERFKLEARTAAQLSHPHIIPIYAVKETASTLFFVMKFVEGKPLDEVIKRMGPLPVPMVKDILTKVGSALGYAHRRGVVHRDIKPANIMIDEEGTPIVTDFGIAKVAEAKGLTMTGTTIGTPTYMSPEQCQAKEVTGASDQYSLGVVAWEMLTGSAPFVGDSAVNTMYKHVHESLPPLEDTRPDCPPEMLETVTRMLAKAPSDRWPKLEAAIRHLSSSTEDELDPIRRELLELARETDPRELIAQLSTPRSPMPSVRSGNRPATAGAAPPSSASRPRRRVGLVTAGVVLLAAVGGTLAVVQPWASDTSPSPVGEAGPATAGDAAATATPTSAPAQGGPAAPAADLAADGSPAPTSSPGASPDGPPTDPPAAGSPAGAPAGATGRSATGSPAPVARVRVDGLRSGLSRGDRIALSAATLSAQGAPTRASTGPQWTSSDPAVGTVAQDGTFTALGPGSVTVTAVVDGVSGSGIITVEATAIGSVTVEPGALTLAPGEAATLTARAIDGGGATTDGEVIWRSDAPGVATVSSRGEVTAVGPGSATITATASGVSRSIGVTVTAPAVDTRSALEGLVDAYARALQSGSIDEVRRAYPGMTSEQERQLRESIQFIERADLGIASLQDSGDTATASVEGTYEFLIDGRRSSSEVSFRATFERVGGTWTMTRTQ